MKMGARSAWKALKPPHEDYGRMRSWPSAPCGMSGRAIALDGQPKVAIGITTYVLPKARSCSPRRAGFALKASCRRRAGGLHWSGKSRSWLKSKNPAFVRT